MIFLFQEACYGFCDRYTELHMQGSFFQIEFFEKHKNSDCFISPKQKRSFWKSFIISTRCQKIKYRLSDTFLKILTNLAWKLAYLISQPMKRIRQTVFRLKTCPQCTSNPVGKIRILDFYHFQLCLSLRKNGHLNTHFLFKGFDQNKLNAF